MTGYTIAPPLQASRYRAPEDYSLTNDFAADYDDADRLTGLSKTNVYDGTTARWNWRIDPAGNRLNEQLEDLVSGTVARHKYTVNDADQLLNVQSGGPLHISGSLNEQGKINTGTSPAKILTKANGSFSAWINTSSASSASFVAEDFNNNTTNKTVTVTPEPLPDFDFEYDANGNTIRMVKTEIDGVTTSETTYEWDALDRLVAINMGTHRSEFTYDGMGRRVRIKEIENSATVSDRFYLWNGLTIIASGPYSSPGITSADKLYFDEGYQSGSSQYYYMKDHLGSVRAVYLRASGIESSYDYDAYGNPEMEEYGTESDFLYTGHFYHRPSGLYLAPYRAYDPKFGRWLSKEPLGLDGPNLYHYVFNDPLNNYDPSGLKKKKSKWKPLPEGHRYREDIDKFGRRHVHVQDRKRHDIAYMTDTGAYLEKHGDSVYVRVRNIPNSVVRALRVVRDRIGKRVVKCVPPVMIYSTYEAYSNGGVDQAAKEAIGYNDFTDAAGAVSEAGISGAESILDSYLGIDDYKEQYEELLK